MDGYLGDHSGRAIYICGPGLDIQEKPQHPGNAGSRKQANFIFSF